MDFNTLQATCLSCQKCGLCQTRTHVVFGMGSPNAEVMFIGEAPGRTEDEQGLPFVGRRAAGMGGLYAVFAGTVSPDTAKNYCMPWPHCRPAPDSARFQRDERTWAVDGKERNFVHRNAAPRGTAAQPQPKASRLR